MTISAAITDNPRLNKPKTWEYTDQPCWHDIHKISGGDTQQRLSMHCQKQNIFVSSNSMRASTIL